MSQLTLLGSCSSQAAPGPLSDDDASPVPGLAGTFRPQIRLRSFVALKVPHVDAQRLSPAQLHKAYEYVNFVEDQEESKALDRSPMPKIIVSASGMATGGRVLHHLKRYLPSARNTVLFAGFQAPGTRGAYMVGGTATVKIHGSYIPVKAEVQNLAMLSAHADSNELMRWLKGFSHAPRETFIVHGEPAASDALRLRIKDELGWSAQAVEQGEQMVLNREPDTAQCRQHNRGND